MANPKGGVFDRFKEEILEMHSRNVPAIDMAHVLKSKHPEQLPGKAKDYAVTIRGNLRRLDVQPSITPSIPSKTTASNDFHALKTELNLHENIYGLPEPLDDSVKTFKLPTGCNNILFITDVIKICFVKRDCFNYFSWRFHARVFYVFVRVILLVIISF